MDAAGAIVESYRQMLECIKPTNTRMTTECETGSFMLGDPTQIQQVLINPATQRVPRHEKRRRSEIRGYRVR